MDYVLNVYATIPKTWTSNPVSVFIQSNEDLIQTYGGVELHWGIGAAMFTALSCHSSCTSCTGPTENDCTGCTLGTQTPVNGKCECNSGTNGAGYYLWADNVCRQYCDANDTSIVFYADSLSRKCVRPMVT